MGQKMIFARKHISGIDDAIQWNRRCNKDMVSGYSSGGSRQRWRKQGLSPREEAADCHHYSRHNKLRVYLFAEEKDGEQRADEWC